MNTGECLINELTEPMSNPNKNRLMDNLPTNNLFAVDVNIVDEIGAVYQIRICIEWGTYEHW